MPVDPLADTCGAGASDDQAVLDAAPKDTTWVTTDGGLDGSGIEDRRSDGELPDS